MLPVMTFIQSRDRKLNSLCIKESLIGFSSIICLIKKKNSGNVFLKPKVTSSIVFLSVQQSKIQFTLI